MDKKDIIDKYGTPFIFTPFRPTDGEMNGTSKPRQFQKKKDQQTQNCCICQDKATTAEHIAKASDGRMMWGRQFSQPIKRLVNPECEASVHTVTVQGINSDVLKYQYNLCSDCNNSRTSAHDKAWEKLSRSLYEKNSTPLLENRIDIHRHYLNVHLFFAKFLLCNLNHFRSWEALGMTENDLLDRLRAAILSPSPHSVEGFSVKICKYSEDYCSRQNAVAAGVQQPDAFSKQIMTSPIYILRENDAGNILNQALGLYYCVGKYAVKMTYLIKIENEPDVHSSSHYWLDVDIQKSRMIDDLQETE